MEALRAEVEGGVQAALDVADRLIGLLDRMDVDPDLEDGGDAEPSLGAPEGHECQIVWLRGNDADREASTPEPALPAAQIEAPSIPRACG